MRCGRAPAPVAELPHLLWLVRRTLRNRTAGVLARLRQPRYAVAMAVGVAYFLLLFAPQFAGPSPNPDGVPAAFADVAALGLAFWLLFWWFRGGYQEALAFDPAEVHHLFPAPLRRTSLIRYKLIRAQAGVIPTAVFLWIFGMARLVPWYMALPGVWLMIETLHLHQVGASLVRVTARQGRGGLRRTVVPMLLIAVIGVAVLWSAASAFQAVRSEPDVAAALAAAAAALRQPVPTAVLAPFRALLAPSFATTPGDWLRAAPLALLILLAHYAWVVRMDAAFEEAAAEAGRKRARIREAVRRGRGWWKVETTDAAERRRWIRLPLRPTGEPAVALLWKHGTAFTGGIRPTTVVLAAAAVAVVLGVATAVSGSVRVGVFAVGAMAAGLALLMLGLGPIATRLDLRRDLEVVEVLRTYPIDSRWLVLAQLAAPTLVILAGYTALLLLAGAAVLLVDRTGELRRVMAGGLFLALAVGPPLIALQVAIHNLVTLLFPGWVRIGPSNAAGIDAMGQGILNFLVAALLFVGLLIPALLLGALIAASFAPALRAWSLLPGAVATLGLLWLEVGFLARWLARLYDELDPVAAGLLH